MDLRHGKPPKRVARVWEAAAYLEGRSSVEVIVGRATLRWRELAVIVRGAGRIWEVRYAGSAARPAARWRVAEVGERKTWQGKMIPAMVRRRYFDSAKRAAEYLIGELRGVGL